MTATKEYNDYIHKTTIDLKMPVNSVLKLIDVSKGHTDNDQLLSYLEMMRESAKKIDDLVNDIHFKSTNNRGLH